MGSLTSEHQVSLIALAYSGVQHAKFDGGLSRTSYAKSGAGALHRNSIGQGSAASRLADASPPKFGSFAWFNDTTRRDSMSTRAATISAPAVAVTSKIVTWYIGGTCSFHHFGLAPPAAASSETVLLAMRLPVSLRPLQIHLPRSTACTASACESRPSFPP